MATTAIGAFRAFSTSPTAPFASFPAPDGFPSTRFRPRRRRLRWSVVAQQEVLQGPSAAYAKEMERLSAKESLLLAFKDAGGFESLVSGKTTAMQQIDVNERIVGLERLNPTPRPTTSPFLEGRWNFEWFEAGSPGLLAAKVLFQRAPGTLAKLSSLNVLIKDGYSKVSTNMKFLSSIEAKLLLTTKLSIEGPIRMKEEYAEGVFEMPSISDEAIPEQLKSAMKQAAGAVQQLPDPIKDVLVNGLKIPLGGTFQRLFMISYLDEEILIIRDSSGSPDVLTRLEAPLESSDGVIVPDYDS